MSYKSEQVKRRIEEIKDKALKDKVQFHNIRTGKNGWVNTYTLAEDDFNFLVEKAEVYYNVVDIFRAKGEHLDLEEEIQWILEESE